MIILDVSSNCLSPYGLKVLFTSLYLNESVVDLDFGTKNFMWKNQVDEVSM